MFVWHGSTNHTNAPTPYIPLLPLHTYPTYLPYITPTNLQNSACLPWPYIPTLPLQPLHPTLHVHPIPAHLLYEQAVRWCGCVLPVMGYYVLRHLLAKYCIWIWLTCWETPEEHGSKPLTRSKNSDISQWQKCFSELKISNPRISCTLNGVRRSSWKVVWVTKSSYASETSFRWQIFCSCSWQAIDMC